jgi:hypothetical protein
MQRPPFTATPARHLPGCARRSRFGCRGNRPTPHRRRRASHVETNSRSRQETAPVQSSKRRPRPGFGSPQSWAFHHRCLWFVRLGVFQALWTYRHLKWRPVSSHSRIGGCGSTAMLRRLKPRSPGGPIGGLALRSGARGLPRCRAWPVGMKLSGEDSIMTKVV